MANGKAHNFTNLFYESSIPHTSIVRDMYDLAGLIFEEVRGVDRISHTAVQSDGVDGE